MAGSRWFWLGSLAELALLGLALLLGLLLGEPAFATWHWSTRDAAYGLAGVVPMGVLFGWMLRSRWQALVNIREVLEDYLVPVMARWSLVQLGVISLIAGVAEEALFRAVVQGALSRWMPAWTALIAASVVFGLGHAATWGYAAVATLIGAYLGVLWLATGNLLCPVTAHAVYDFLALVYLMRWRIRS